MIRQRNLFRVAFVLPHNLQLAANYKSLFASGMFAVDRHRHDRSRGFGCRRIELGVMPLRLHNPIAVGSKTSHQQRPFRSRQSLRRLIQLGNASAPAEIA